MDSTTHKELDMIDMLDHDAVHGLALELDHDAVVTASNVTYSPYWYINIDRGEGKFYCISSAEEHGEGPIYWVGIYTDETMEHQLEMHDCGTLAQLKEVL